MEDGNERRKGVLCGAEADYRRNLWSELDAQRKLDTGNKHVQKEGQAAHFPCKGNVQPVQRREGGVAALAAVW